MARRDCQTGGKMEQPTPKEMTITPVTRDLRNPANRYFIAIKARHYRTQAGPEELYRAQPDASDHPDTHSSTRFWKDRNCTYQAAIGFLRRCGFRQSAGDRPAKSDFDLAWSETAEVYRADDHLVMEQGSAKLGYEEIQDRPDGSRVLAPDQQGAPADQEGKVTGVIGTYEDITERKQAEQAPANLGKTYRLLFDANMAGVFAPHEGRVLECNHARPLVLFGYDSARGSPGRPGDKSCITRAF